MDTECSPLHASSDLHRVSVALVLVKAGLVFLSSHFSPIQLPSTQVDLDHPFPYCSNMLQDSSLKFFSVKSKY